MSKKIEKLTKEQEKYLPVFRKEYFDAATSSKRIDRTKLEAAIEDAYAEIGKKKPMVMIFQSPRQAMMAIKFMQHFAKKETGEVLWDQLWDQLWGQLRGQLRGQLWGQLWDQLGDQLGDQLRGQSIYDSNYLWGSQDLYWIAWARFAAHVGVKFTEQQGKRLDIMERIGFQCEWWWPYEGICFVSEKPVEINWDENRRLHGEGKPSVKYDDGYAIYSWHGTAIPAEWIEDKKYLTPEIALKLVNMDQRRAACEIIGWAKILKALKAKTVEKDEDPQIGELLEVTIPDIGKEKFLRVVCGTGREFALPVPPDMKTALQANAWTYGLEADQYKPEVRT